MQMNDDILKTIGVRVAAFRSALGMPPEALCAGVGMSRKMLTRIEAGKADIKATLLVRIARHLGVRLSALVGEEKFGGFVEEGGAS